MIFLESDMQTNKASRMHTSFSIWQQILLHEEDWFNSLNPKNIIPYEGKQLPTAARTLLHTEYKYFSIKIQGFHKHNPVFFLPVYRWCIKGPDGRVCINSKLGNTWILGYWLVKHSQKNGFKPRKSAHAWSLVRLHIGFEEYHLFTFIRNYIFPYKF